MRRPRPLMCSRQVNQVTSEVVSKCRLCSIAIAYGSSYKMTLALVTILLVLIGQASSSQLFTNLNRKIAKDEVMMSRPTSGQRPSTMRSSPVSEQKVKISISHDINPNLTEASSSSIPEPNSDQKFGTYESHNMNHSFQAKPDEASTQPDAITEKTLAANVSWESPLVDHDTAMPSKSSTGPEDDHNTSMPSQSRTSPEVDHATSISSPSKSSTGLEVDQDNSKPSKSSTGPEVDMDNSMPSKSSTGPEKENIVVNKKGLSEDYTSLGSKSSLEEQQMPTLEEADSDKDEIMLKRNINKGESKQEDAKTVISSPIKMENKKSHKFFLLETVSAEVADERRTALDRRIRRLKSKPNDENNDNKHSPKKKLEVARGLVAEVNQIKNDGETVKTQTTEKNANTTTLNTTKEVSTNKIKSEGTRLISVGGVKPPELRERGTYKLSEKGRVTWQRAELEESTLPPMIDSTASPKESNSNTTDGALDYADDGDSLKSTQVHLTMTEKQLDGKIPESTEAMIPGFVVENTERTNLNRSLVHVGG